MAAKIVTSDDVSEDGLVFVTEASTLGLKPGEWPQKLETTLGNKLPFYRYSAIMLDDEFCGAIYKQSLGCISLKVYND